MTPFHKYFIDHRWPCFAMLLVATFSIAAFMPGLAGGFVYDDHIYMGPGCELFAPGAWARVWSSAALQLYRPITSLSLWLDFSLWGWKPFGWHVQSLMWHCLNCVLLLFLLRRCGLSLAAATLGAAWFAVHPIHVESVVWISARGTLISTAGVFGCLLAYVNWRERHEGGALAALAGFGLLGFFSKEVALMVLPVLCVMEVWVCSDGNWRGLLQRRFLLPFSLLLALALFYLGLRQHLLTGLEQGTWAAGFTGLLSTLPVILVRYMGQLLYPLTLNVDPFIDYTCGFNARFWACVIGLGALAFSLTGPLARYARWKGCVAIFFITLAPTMGLIPINQASADRFLYLPSMAVALLLGTAYEQACTRWPRWRGPAIGMAGLWFALLGIRSWTYSQVWKDDLRLWRHVVSHNPTSYRGFANLASIAANQKAPEQGLPLVDHALALNPKYAEAMVIKAFILDALGRRTEAVALCRQALDRDPTNTEWMFHLATFLENDKQWSAAEELYDRITILRPGYVRARLNAGCLAAQMKHPEKAAEHWRAVLRYDPNNVAAQTNLKRLQKSLNGASLLNREKHIDAPQGMPGNGMTK